MPQALSREDRIRVAAGDSERVQVTPLQLLQMAAVVAGRGQARSRGEGSGRQGPRLGNLAAVEVLREAMRQAAESGTLEATRLGTLEGRGRRAPRAGTRAGTRTAGSSGSRPSARHASRWWSSPGRDVEPTEAAQPGTELLSLALGGDAPKSTPWERPRATCASASWRSWARCASGS
ncbi:hypothetical protein ACN28S_25195 [Cystobacter fuscus]